MRLLICTAVLATMCLLSSEAKKNHNRHHKKSKVKEPKFISYGLPDALSTNLTTENYLTFITFKNCKNEKPWCLGKDCGIVPDEQGCMICACPMASKSRGCDKMPLELYNDLWLNGCPKVENHKMTRIPPQKITRWYRHIELENKIDECRYYTEPFYPYCPDLDENLWNGPQTEDECKQICFARNPPVAANKKGAARN